MQRLPHPDRGPAQEHPLIPWPPVQFRPEAQHDSDLRLCAAGEGHFGFTPLLLPQFVKEFRRFRPPFQQGELPFLAPRRSLFCNPARFPGRSSGQSRQAGRLLNCWPSNFGGTHLRTMSDVAAGKVLMTKFQFVSHPALSHSAGSRERSWSDSGSLNLRREAWRRTKRSNHVAAWKQVRSRTVSPRAAPACLVTNGGHTDSLKRWSDIDMRIAGLKRTCRTARKLEHYLRDGRPVVETRRFLGVSRRPGMLQLGRCTTGNLQGRLYSKHRSSRSAVPAVLASRGIRCPADAGRLPKSPPSQGTCTR